MVEIASQLHYTTHFITITNQPTNHPTLLGHIATREYFIHSFHYTDDDDSLNFLTHRYIPTQSKHQLPYFVPVSWFSQQHNKWNMSELSNKSH